MNNTKTTFDILKSFFLFETNKIEIISNGLEDTNSLAKDFASFLSSTDVISLDGELGAGKTAFVSGMAKYFEIENQVCSPTFTIVNEYSAKNNLKIYHFDVYRVIDETNFLESIGTDYFSNGLCIIEWGNIIKNVLPKNTIYINILKDETNDNVRKFLISREVENEHTSN